MTSMLLKLNRGLFLFCGALGMAQEVTVKEHMEVVYSAEDFRMSSDDERSVLVYDNSFFDRFEPVSVGDILKRVPGVSGSADAGEFDKPQMRGLDPSYTQILINGKRIPSRDSDHSVFVDWIPADLVERIEIIRSPSSDMDSQGVGGSINIVLKDAKSTNSALMAQSQFYSTSDKTRAKGSASVGFSKNQTSFSAMAMFHRRHNPKVQQSDIFDNEGERLFKDESNVLDSDELNMLLSLDHRWGQDNLLHAQFYVHDSDRQEFEDSSFFADGEFEEGSFDHALINQRNMGGQISYQTQWGTDSIFHLSLDHHKIELDNRADFGEFDEEERHVDEIEFNQSDDRETQVNVWFTKEVSSVYRYKLGVDLKQKTRHSRQETFEVDEGELESVADHGVYDLTEDRLDSYIMGTWRPTPRFSVQTGFRFEQTEFKTSGNNPQDRSELLPAWHFRFDMTSATSLRLDLSRTTRRPDFQDLVPHERRDEPREGRSTIGNPSLQYELANGVDLGVEQKFLAHEGTWGVNLFYRNIRHLIESIEIDDDLFQPRNLDEGNVWGIELDFGAPLTMIKAPNVSLFANLTLQDSEVRDPVSNAKRRFNMQAGYVGNVGFIHYLNGVGASYGLHYLIQGKSSDLEFSEQSRVDYGNDLELVLEKRWGSRFSLRLSGKNLLNSPRSEFIEEFDGYRGLDEIEQTSKERETSGRTYLLTFRMGF